MASGYEFPYWFKSLAALGHALRLRVSSLRCGPLRLRAQCKR
jgi:hypothetical protein